METRIGYLIWTPHALYKAYERKVRENLVTHASLKQGVYFRKEIYWLPICPRIMHLHP